MRISFLPISQISHYNEELAIAYWASVLRTFITRPPVEVQQYVDFNQFLNEPHKNVRRILIEYQQKHSHAYFTELFTADHWFAAEFEKARRLMKSLTRIRHLLFANSSEISIDQHKQYIRTDNFHDAENLIFKYHKLCSNYAKINELDQLIPGTVHNPAYWRIREKSKTG